MSEYELTEILDEVLNFECAWINHWAYEEGYSRLTEMKQFALAHKNELRQQFGCVIEDVYLQLQEFESLIATTPTITGTRDEAIILSAFKYAKQKKMIITRRWGNIVSKLKPPRIDKDDFLYSEYAAWQNLISYDILNWNISQCATRMKDNILPFLDFNECLLKQFPNRKENFYSVPLTISVLKKLLNEKDFLLAQKIIDGYTLTTIGKKDTTNLEKIKEKIYRRI